MELIYDIEKMGFVAEVLPDGKRYFSHSSFDMTFTNQYGQFEVRPKSCRLSIKGGAASTVVCDGTSIQIDGVTRYMREGADMHITVDLFREEPGFVLDVFDGDVMISFYWNESGGYLYNEVSCCERLILKDEEGR